MGVLDKRLVRTLLQCLVAIIRFRNDAQALWRERTGFLFAGVQGLLQCSSRNQAGQQAAEISQMDGGTQALEYERAGLQR